ncbi:MAG: hypothetical protein GTO24_15060 [candidate division Zixibacteria bacterium]|nr:hypothetical protein [candidate division Zixibacteria bacterium]
MKTKRSIYRVLSAFVICILFILSALWDPAAAATEAEVESAVTNGLSWLAAQQNPDGSWSGFRDEEPVAHTGLALLAFEMQAIELGLDPMSPDYNYGENVESGLDYIFRQIHYEDISSKPEADGNGNGIATYFMVGTGRHVIYNTSIAMMAIAASDHPELYHDDLQDAVDYLAWAQRGSDDGIYQGGWSYSDSWFGADNSNSGYAISALGFAAAPPPYGFELIIPEFVKGNLNLWINAIQDDVDGDTHDGGSWWIPSARFWVNIFKTGNLLYEMALVGDTAETPRVQDAIDYIERHWNDPGNYKFATGWRGDNQTMFAIMEGFESLGIDRIDIDGDGVPEHDWFNEVSTNLVDTQKGDGSWPNGPWDDYGPPILSTAWALLTLQKAVPRSEAFDPEVFVDIKPGSCPNPLNVRSKGVLPVAVLGNEDFDVTTIDPAGVRLEGVAPIRWSYEDVATPFEGEPEACHDLNGDGYMDLTLKFDVPELVGTLALNQLAGETILLQLTGILTDEYGGAPIVGEDPIRLLNRGKNVSSGKKK